MIINIKDFGKYSPISLLLVGKKVLAIRRITEQQGVKFSEAKRIADRLEIKWRLISNRRIKHLLSFESFRNNTSDRLFRERLGVKEKNDVTRP